MPRSCKPSAPPNMRRRTSSLRRLTTSTRRCRCIPAAPPSPRAATATLPSELAPLASISHPVNPETAGGLAISLQHVSRIFGRFAALRDVTADFVSGRMCVILGENGAGKSTLLRVIAGLIRPSTGTVSIFGSADREHAHAAMGYMGHATLLYDEMTALENLTYFARLHGIQSRERCEQVIAEVGLDPRLPRYVGQYSQGMRQRTALARA